ncbi:MAG: hypothetical protein M3Y87_32135, partial [Myxococcota bacterium]|nr:hypothetical protein [Myxococcota bacterium]
MKRAIGIVGVGQLGGIFGQGLLRQGRPVLPILRGESIAALEAHDPELVLIAVGESDLAPTLAAVPASLRGRLALVQNELLPPDWEAHGIVDPTVAVVWFEKKRGRAAHVVRTTRVGGPNAELLARALESVELPARRVEARDLAFELVRKNVYIVVSNVAGLAVGGTTGELCAQHRGLATSIAEDVIAIEQARLGVELPRESLVECAFLDFAKDPAHATMGRSAPDRLARAIARADRAGLAAPA